MDVIHRLRAPTPPRASDGGGLIWRLDAGLLPRLAPVIHCEGQRLLRKREFHLTLVRRAWMQALETRQRQAVDAWLDRAWPGLDHGIALLDEMWLLREGEDGTVLHSLAVACLSPAMDAVRAGLSKVAGEPLPQALPQAPPHITLYSDDGIAGVGLPDLDTLHARRQRTLRWREL